MVRSLTEVRSGQTRETSVGDLSRYWYIAARSPQLASQPIRRTILGRHLVLFRETSGRPAALVDQCAHRNMALSQGRVVGETLECCYHGWRYDAAGACVHVPSLSATEKPPGICVRSFLVVEHDGFVWVYLGDDVPTQQPFRFPHYGEPGWVSFTMQTRFEAGVEACLENFLDCPHTVFVHQGWFRTHKPKAVTARIQRFSDRVVAEFINEPITPSLVSRLLFPSKESLQHTDQFIMPSVSRVDYRFGNRRHFIITSQCTPVTNEETVVYTVITYRFPPIGPLVRLVFEPMCRVIIRQDIEILRAQTENIRRFGGPSFTSIKTDVLGPHIQWLRRHATHPDAAPEETVPVTYEVPICF